ncbi:MAG: protein kinase [Pseudomonadota bacterium]
MALVEDGHSLSEGSMVDEFKIIRLLGRGGMGEVYLARDTKLGRKVALKLIHPRYLGSEEAVSKFQREAQVTASFCHPHIVTVFTVGEYLGRPYLALEYLEGQDLRQRLQEERPGIKESIRIGLAIAKALAEAHRSRILHRDLKPENVLLAKDGRLRVLDLGLAKLVGGRDAESQGGITEVSDGGGNAALDAVEVSDATHSGTPAYMAPERWRGEDCTEAADVWALGVMLYELATGRRPYQLPSWEALGKAIVSPEPVPSVVVEGEVPPELAALVDRCLDKDPRKRPAALAVAEELERQLGGGRHQVLAESSPFRGLFPFGERHADVFFGRDAEIAAFLEHLREQAMLPIVGPSGAGKSSFVQAGVVPRLREQGSWVVLIIRPGNDPLASLAARFERGESTWSVPTSIATVHTIDLRGEAQAGPRSEAIGDGNLATDATLATRIMESPRLLGALLEELAERTRSKVLLCVDQLEEAYTLVDDELVRSRFMQAVGNAADDPRGPVRVVFTVRDDFLGRVTEGGDFGSALNKVTVLRRPGPGALEEILRRPLEAVGYGYDDPGLVTTMVAAVRGEPACLPLLQFASQVLWDRRDKERKCLCRNVYEAMGGVAGALAEHADGVLEGLSPAQLKIARELLLRLVTAEGTRKVIPAAGALHGLGDDAKDVLTKLVQARLLTMRKGGSETKGDAVLELVHESLIRSWSRLAKWIDESREELVFLGETSQAAELWDKRGRRDEEVWQGRALFEAQSTLERCSSRVPPLVEQFIAAGRRKESRARQRRKLAVGGAMLVLGAIALGAVLVARETGRQRDRAEAQRAEAQLQGAKAALARGDLLEARAQLRGSLETQDSSLSRALWWRIDGQPLLWSRDYGAWMLDVAFSPDGKTVASACADGRAYLFDTASALPRVLRGQQGSSWSVEFSPDGRLLALGTSSGQVVLWELERGTSKVMPGEHRGIVYGVAFSPDSRLLASAGEDAAVMLWDLADGRAGRVLSGHRKFVTRVAFSPDGRVLASVSADTSLRLWDVGAGAEQAVLLAGNSLFGLAFAPDGRVIATAGFDRAVKLWDSSDDTGQTRVSQQTTFLGHTDIVSGVAISSDGRLVASCGLDKTIRIWQAREGAAKPSRAVAREERQPRGELVQPLGARAHRELAVFRGHTDIITSVVFSPDAKYLASSGRDNTVRLWKTGADGVVDTIPIGHSGGVVRVGFSPDGSKLASGGEDKTIRIWETRSGAQLGVLEGHEGSVPGIAFSPDGSVLASGSADRSVRLWNPADGAELRALAGHTAPAWEVAYSPDGTLLASASNDNTVRLWDVQSRSEKGALSHQSYVNDVAFSRDGATIASATYDGKVYLWDAHARVVVKVLSGHGGSAQSVAISPDGATLFSSGVDGTIRSWDRASGTGHVLGKHAGPAGGISASLDGRYLGTASDDGTARIWDLRTGDFKVLRGHRGSVTDCCLGPDGTLAATTGADGTLRLWTVEDGMPYWRAPLPAKHGTSDKSVDTGNTGNTGNAAAESTGAELWRANVEKHGIFAGQSQRGDLLCVQTDIGSIELWDLASDRLLSTRAIENIDSVAAPAGGCLILAQGKALLVERSGGVVELATAARAVGWHESESLVATDREVLVFDEAGTRKAAHAVDRGATAVGSIGEYLVVGFDAGDVELLPQHAVTPKKSFAFEAVPASQVTRVVRGPRETIVVGYASGALGIWSTENGSRLHFWKLHGPISHLTIAGDRLLAATEIGGYLDIDLQVFHQGHCALLRRIWDQVPVVWVAGLPVPRSRPTSHRCLGE